MSIVTNVCEQPVQIEALSEVNTDIAHGKVYENVVENTLNNLYKSSK